MKYKHNFKTKSNEHSLRQVIPIKNFIKNIYIYKQKNEKKKEKKTLPCEVWKVTHTCSKKS